MTVRILTPTDVLLDSEAIHVTAEDPSGSLGIRPGHAPLITPLVPTIVTVRGAGGSEQYVAVNGGVMIVNDDHIDIVSRQGATSTNMQQLEDTTLAQFESEEDEAKSNRVAFERMRLTFMRHMLEVERTGR